jgi:hypothetical protein
VLVELLLGVFGWGAGVCVFMWAWFLVVSGSSAGACSGVFGPAVVS